jgi:hypothetical protein
MAGCEPSDEVRRIIRAMARAKVEEGFTDAGAIVDEIHEAIKDHTPLWKGEIADIIAGVGQPKRQATKSELQAKMEQLRRDLKATYHPSQPKTPKTPEQAANERRQAAIRRQMAEIQEALRTGNFDKRRPTIADDRETQDMRQQLAVAKREADKALADIARKNRTPTQKALETMGAMYRAAILSGYTVFEHLTGASLGRFLTAPLEELAGAGLHHVPGLRAISEGAPTEGGASSAQALKQGYLKIVSGETGKAIRDKLVRGYSDRQALYDKHVDYGAHWLSLLGHLHDAIKTPVEQFAFYKALHTVNAKMRRDLERAGKSPDEIDAELTREYTMARNGALAYAYSKAAKLQGDNWLVDMVNGAVRQLATKGPVGKGAAGLARLTMPILRIPTNFAKETSEYALGLGNALATAIYHHGEEFTPEINDHIFRNLKKGLVGAALAPLFWIIASSMGALYDDKRRKKGGEPEYGDIRTPVGTLSHHMLHIPLIEFGQMIALTKRIAMHDAGKVDKKTGEVTPAIEAAANGALRSAVALGRTLPFVPDDIAGALRDTKGLGNYTGKLAAGFIPQAVQQAARGLDPDKAPRRPQGFAQQLEAAIPGLRQNVPHRDLKGMTLDSKLDLYEKMSPRERQSSGITESILKSAHSQRANLSDDQIRRIEALEGGE